MAVASGRARAGSAGAGSGGCARAGGAAPPSVRLKRPSSREPEGQGPRPLFECVYFKTTLLYPLIFIFLFGLKLWLVPSVLSHVL